LETESQEKKREADLARLREEAELKKELEAKKAREEEEEK